MHELAAALLRYTDAQPSTSPYVTAVDGVAILRADQPKPPAFRSAAPALCIVAQGAKWASFGGETLEYRAGQALVVGIDTPSQGRVFEASPDKPCLVLVIALDLAMLRAVAAHMSLPPTKHESASRGVFVANFDGPLADCALRIVRLLDTPDAVEFVYPLVMREMCYWLLRSAQGAEIANLISTDNGTPGLLRALDNLRERFAEPVRVEDLADIAQLSPSAFHRQFKALTGLPPLQYQKQIRLLEARRLLLSQAVSVQAAAYAVGYESASQFSREYARMFGLPPGKDSVKAKGMREVA